MSERGDVKTRFQKGQSGNPGGRAKVAEEFKVAARKAADEHVLKLWVAEIVSGGDNRMKASELLAAYAYGKPSSAPEDLKAAAEGLTVVIQKLAAGGGENG